MDHLPLLTGGRDLYNKRRDGEASSPAQHMVVPLLEGATYDGKGFDGALERMGMSEERILNTLFDEREDSFVDSCIQQYLYFGLLHEFHSILGLTENMPTFKKQMPDGTFVLTTEPLISTTVPAIWNKILKPLIPDWVYSQVPNDLKSGAETRWLVDWVQDKDAELNPFRKRLYRLLKHVWNILNRITRHLFAKRVQFSVTFTPRFKICLCVNLLLECIDQIARKMLCFTVAGGGVQWTEERRGYSQILVEYVRRQGWCSWNISDLSGANLSLMYVAALTGPLDRQKHNNCTSRSCQEYYGSYPQQTHRRNCGGQCEIYVVSESQMVSILDSDDYPVITGLKKESTELEISASSELSCGHVAISHVWRHGLGNDKINAIQRCQFEFIIGLVEAIAGKGCGLWLDTLCVPVSAEHQKHRKYAIRKMRDTYSSAAAVLVLDKLLQRIGPDPLEQRVYLILSDWIHRIWTLQEALLPGYEKVFVKFRDNNPVQLIQLFRKFFYNQYTFVGPELFTNLILSHQFQLNSSVLYAQKETISMSQGLLAVDELVEGSSSLQRDSNDREARRRANRLAHFATVFQRRDTSKPADEAVCLAILLGLEPSDSEELPLMELVYSKCGKIPASLIFSTCPRLSTPGFRALPRTFRRHLSNLKHTRKEDFEAASYLATILEGEGVGIRYPAYIFEDFELGLTAGGIFRGILERYDAGSAAMCQAGPCLEIDRLEGNLVAVIPRFNEERMLKLHGNFLPCIIVTGLKHHPTVESLLIGSYLASGILTCRIDPDDQKKFTSAAIPHFAAEYYDEVSWVLD